MNCETFQELAVDWARRRKLCPEGEAHRAVCERCAAVWDEECALSSAFADIQDLPGPSPALEAAVVGAWKRRRASRIWRPVAWAVAAAILLGVLLLPRKPAPAAAVSTSIDFLPLRAGPVLAPGESAQLVRIRLRRSEARRFGLPVSMDGDGRPVDAEVWIGEDGAARAVRFIPVKE